MSAQYRRPARLATDHEFALGRTLIALVATLALPVAPAAAQSAADVRVGLMRAQQFSTQNNRDSVDVFADAGAQLFSVPDASRGDYRVGFGTGDDLSRGVLIVSPRNALRTNATNGNEGGNVGGNVYATVATARPGSKIDLFAAVCGAPSGQEMNIDVAAAFFSFDDGFIAGHALNSVNNGPITPLIASEGLALGSTFVDSSQTEGVYRVDLSGFGATGNNGVLIACGGKNEDNFAAVRNLGGGRYEVLCKDNGTDGPAGENDPVAFVYLPYSTPGLTAGRIAQNGSFTAALSGTGSFAATTLGTGRILLTIHGVTTDTAGALLVVPEATPTNSDNIIAARWSDADQGYIIDTLDIPTMTNEDPGGAAMLSFAYVPIGPGPGIERGGFASTLVVLPDTQYYARDNPAIFDSQLQWISDEADNRRIEMVLHLGDITNDNNTAQWPVARNAFDLIEGEVPYILAQGNHDVGPSGNAANRDTLFNEYFTAADYALQPTFGGALSNRALENSYSQFEAAGRKWIALSLEWGPRDQVLDWGNTVLANHSDRLAIVITHAYMFRDDTRMDQQAGDYLASPYTYATASLPGGTNDGGDIWRELVSQHPNTVMVMSGHITGEGRLSSPTAFGNTAHQMLIDYQGRDDDGAGYLRYIELHPGSDLMRFRTYSPWTDGMYTGTGSHFELPLVTAPGHEGWVCSRADVNGDGVLTPSDFSFWVLGFTADEPWCDQNVDGACTPTDFNAWILRFNSGCE
ncbi:MAG: GC-type dockerin domain-anchored protein [Planctomycetota bacterium]